MLLKNLIWWYKLWIIIEEQIARLSSVVIDEWNQSTLIEIEEIWILYSWFGGLGCCIFEEGGGVDIISWWSGEA